MTFEEWYDKIGFQLFQSEKSIKEILYETYVTGWSSGFNEAKVDKDYEV
mgnify:CR=1 FL=1